MAEEEDRKRVLVVGGSGYLGQHLLAALASAAGRLDVAFTHHSQAPPQPLLDALPSVRADLRSGDGFETIAASFGQVKPLWELSNNADIADLKLFWETQLGLDLRSPLHVKNDEKILLLLKPYGLEKELRSVGRLSIKASSEPSEIVTKQDEIAGFTQSEGSKFHEMGVKFKSAASCSGKSMKRQADKKRSERQFQVGDMVFVKIQPYIQSTLAPRSNQKLSYKYYGPFEIISKIGTVAYKLLLPPTTTVHPVFHVSQLKAAVLPGTIVIPSLPSATDISRVPEEILQTRTVPSPSGSTEQVLIRWSGWDEVMATWGSCLGSSRFSRTGECYTRSGVGPSR